MLARTNIAEARWWVVEAVDKKRARLNCIHHLLTQFNYAPIEHPPVVLPSAPTVQTTSAIPCRRSCSSRPSTEAPPQAALGPRNSATNRRSGPRAGEGDVAELVDAADLKSASRSRVCGFESHRPHQRPGSTPGGLVLSPKGPIYKAATQLDPGRKTSWPVPCRTPLTSPRKSRAFSPCSRRINGTSKPRPSEQRKAKLAKLKSAVEANADNIIAAVQEDTRKPAGEIRGHGGC